MIADVEQPGETALEDLQRQVDALDEAALQRLLTVVARSYSRRSLDRREWEIAPFAPDAEVTATEALICAGSILRAAEISSFELAAIFNF